MLQHAGAAPDATIPHTFGRPPCIRKAQRAQHVAETVGTVYTRIRNIRKAPSFGGCAPGRLVPWPLVAQRLQALDIALVRVARVVQRLVLRQAQRRRLQTRFHTCIDVSTPVRQHGSASCVGGTCIKRLLLCPGTILTGYADQLSMVRSPAVECSSFQQSQPQKKDKLLHAPLTAPPAAPAASPVGCRHHLGTHQRRCEGGPHPPAHCPAMYCSAEDLKFGALH